MPTKRILLISYYFPPDLAAGSFRVESLLDALIEDADADTELELIAASPSRYSSFLMAAESEEYYRGVRIRRLKVPFMGRSLPAQSLRHLLFSLRLLLLLRGCRYDVVVATSSRLMTGVVGSRIAKMVKARLYLDIRDIFTEVLAEIFPGKLFGPLHGFLRYLERKTLQSADHINYVSQGFLPYFDNLSLSVSTSAHTNGIDDVFLEQNWTEAPANDTRPEVFYAGNVGEGQGLHKLLPELAERCSERFRFTVMGDGGKAHLLRQACDQRGVSNVTILPPVSRLELIARYKQADVLFLQLNDLLAFQRVLPSKLLEYAATSKPILAGVSGYAQQFIEQHISGVGLFPPCDVMAAKRALEAIVLAPVDRGEFCQLFARRRIMAKMAAEVLALANTDH